MKAETWPRTFGADTGSEKEEAAEVQNIILQHLGREKKGKDKVSARGGCNDIGGYRSHREVPEKGDKLKIEKKEGVMSRIML